MRKPSKHLAYYAVLEALAQPGCFLCTLIADGTRRYLRFLLNEFVNDPGFREKWRASRGFCHRHSWMMADAPEALGLGILYLDLVKLYGKELLERPSGMACPVCAVEERELAGHLSAIVGHWPEQQLQDVFEKSDGLCGPHFRASMRVIADEGPREAIRRVSTRGMAELQSRLTQLIESFDYRNPAAEDEAVRRAWQSAIERMVGARDTDR